MYAAPRYFARSYFGGVWPSVTGWLATSLVVGSPEIGTPVLHQKHALLPTGLTVDSPAIAQALFQQRHALLANALATASPSLGSPQLRLTYVLTALGVTVQSPIFGTPEFEAFSQEILGALTATEDPDIAALVGQAEALGLLAATEGSDGVIFVGNVPVAYISEKVTVIGRADSEEDVSGRGGRRTLH